MAGVAVAHTGALVLWGARYALVMLPSRDPLSQGRWRMG